MIADARLVMSHAFTPRVSATTDRIGNNNHPAGTQGLTMTRFTDYRDHLGSRTDKVFKATLFQGERLMLGLNCLDPGQEQRVHTHADQDKFYFVLEGEGTFVVGEETRVCGTGHAIGAPAGVEHGVTNHGTTALVLLVGMGPPPTS